MHFIKLYLIGKNFGQAIHRSLLNTEGFSCLTLDYFREKTKNSSIDYSIDTGFIAYFIIYVKKTHKKIV